MLPRLSPMSVATPHQLDCMPAGIRHYSVSVVDAQAKGEVVLFLGYLSVLSSFRFVNCLQSPVWARLYLIDML